MCTFLQRKIAGPTAGKLRPSVLVASGCVGLLALGVVVWLRFGQVPTEAGKSDSRSPAAGDGADLAVSKDGILDKADGARPLPERWEERWRALSAETTSDARTAGLIALLEELVAVDPFRALSFARAEADPQQRGKFLFGVLCAWAKNDPETAMARARELPQADRADGIAAVLTGAAHAPEIAVQLAKRLSREDPAQAREYGYALITALSQVGEYRTAVRFASAPEDPGAGESEDRLKLTQHAFGSWARQEPENAAIATLSLPDAGARYEAMLAVVADWVRVDPYGLTEFVQQLPPGADRTNTLSEALRLWVKNNPKAAADWMDHLNPSPELDAGVTALATLPQLVEQHPTVAISWAESIENREQRSNALTGIVRQWSSFDPVAARRYVEQSTDLLPADRQRLLAPKP